MSASGTTRFSRLSRSLALAARIAATRFPATAVLIVLFSLVANFAAQDIFVVAEDDIPGLMAALFAAAGAAVLTRLSAESHDWRRALQVVAPAAAASMIGLAIWFAKDVGLFAPPLIVAITAAIPLAPYAGRPDDRRFWAFTLWATVGVTLAMISVLLFTLGLSAIMAMVGFLFDVDFASSVYEHIYITAATLVGPLFALGRIPSDFDDTVAVDAEDRLAQGLRFLFDWVAAPLTLLTAVVLHLYAAKILVLGEVPKNEIGWIVTFYAVLVLSFRIVVDPFIADGAVTMTTFGRAWALMLIVPTALLVYAASLRIQSQGFTVERYYLALDALTITLVIVAQAVRPLRGDIRLISGIPLLLLALSSFGPWGVADTIGRSQTARLGQDLAEAGGAGSVAGMPLDKTKRWAAVSRLDALEEVGEIHRALELLSEQQRREVAARSDAGEAGLRRALDEALGVSSIVADAPGEVHATFNASRRVALDLTGFDLGLAEQYFDGPFPTAAAAQDEARMAGLGVDDGRMMALDGSDLVLRLAGIEDRFSLKPAFDALPLGAGATAVPGSVPPVVVDLRSENGRRARLSITSASVMIGSERQPLALTVSVFLRRVDWPASTATSLGGEAEGGRRETKPAGAIGERPR